jgi:diguanylate cyclase (GGDEF)-like protein
LALPPTAAGSLTYVDITRQKQEQDIQQHARDAAERGEEFAVILPAIPASTALRAAERLRSQVADTVVAFGDATIRLTISLGVAMARETDRSIEQALARADAALYTAKGTGRDRVVSCDEVAAVA